MKYLDDTGLSLLWSKMKGLIPSSLPANGGNADTVDGKHYSDILCGSVKSAKMYVDNDTHIAKLGYFDLSKGEYSSTALMVGNGFWGNQHNCCELIIIGSDLYGVDDDGVAKFTISKIHLGGSYERTLYYKVNGKKVEIYVACYGGNGYGKWFSKVIGSNESNLWYADFVENCSSADLTEIGYAGVFGSATKLANARTIAIGNTGKFFDGSGDVSWSLSEIGAAASDHDHTTLNTAFKFNNNDVPSSLTNLAYGTTSNVMTFYRNGILISSPMGRADGGAIRVTGTNESDTVLEIATWDDYGTGETIQFNYYPWTSSTTPTYSVTVPKKSGTIALTSDLAKYLPLTGGTLTGELTTTSIKPSVANTYSLGTKALHYTTVYARNICGENGSAVDISHQIALGYSGHDRIDFDEWGGAFYFNKTSTGARVEIASILSTGATFTMPMSIGSSSGNLNSAIKFGTGNAKISYYGNQVIFNTADALRFGHTDWDWDKWAGLGYDATNKIIYLGLADGSIFQASNAQSGGTLNLVAVDTLKTSTGKLTVAPSIIFNNGVATDSIEHHTAGGNLCIGDCTNSGLVAIVEDLCGYDDTDANGDGDYETWAITMDGNATFEEVVASQLNVTGTADFKTDVTIETQLFVFDEIKVNGDIISDGAICNGTLQVDEGATLSSTLSVKGATTLSSTLNVTGATTLASTLSVTGATTLSGKLDVSGVTTLKGRLTCSNLTVTNFISTNAMTYGVKTLTMLTAADRVRAESTLEVAGATTLSSTLSVKGSAELSDLTCSSLSVTGSTSLDSTLKVTGDTTLAANLSVGGSVNTYTITHEEGAEMFIGNDGNTNYVAFVEDLEGYDRDNEESTWQLSTAGNLSNLASVSATNATIGTLTLTSGLKIQASSTQTYTFNTAKAISLGLIS